MPHVNTQVNFIKIGSRDLQGTRIYIFNCCSDRKLPGKPVLLGRMGLNQNDTLSKFKNNQQRPLVEISYNFKLLINTAKDKDQKILTNYQILSIR